MALKDLEQDGDEDFTKFDTRKQVKTKNILAELLKNSNISVEKAKKQEEWLHPSNDELWTDH